jgi:hypothetical protein
VNISEFADSDIVKENMRVRVKYRGRDCLGEVARKVGNDKYEIRIAKRNVTGWSTQEDCDLVVFDAKNLILIDKGLNSPWKVDTQKLRLILQKMEKDNECKNTI